MFNNDLPLSLTVLLGQYLHVVIKQTEDEFKMEWIGFERKDCESISFLQYDALLRNDASGEMMHNSEWRTLHCKLQPHTIGLCSYQ